MKGKPMNNQPEDSGRIQQAEAPDSRPAPRRSRISYLSLLSVVSAFAVLSLHTNSAFWHVDATPGSYWPSANVIDALWYFAVPVFFMVSGATLVGYRERYGTATFFAKRAKKTLAPFLFWSLCGLAFTYFAMGQRDLDLSPLAVIDGILNTRYITIYWFFPPLFLLYLAMPLLSAIRPELRREVFAYGAAVLFVCSSLIPFVIAVFELPLSWPLTVSGPLQYLIYTFLGYVLANSSPSLRQRICIYVLGLASLVGHIWATYTLSLAAGEVSSLWKGYEKPPAVLYSVAVFILLKEIGQRLGPRAIKAFDWLAAYSFPAYLLHWFILRITVIVFDPDTTLLAYRVLMPIAIYAVVILVGAIVRRIPGGRVILP